MLKGILGAVLANYQPSKNIISTKTCNYAHTRAHRHTIPSHPLSPLFPTSALSPPKPSPFLLPVVVLPFSAPYDSHDPPCLISLLCLSSLFHFLLSVYPSPSSQFQPYPLSQLSPLVSTSPIYVFQSPLFFLLHLLLPPAPLPPPSPKQMLK